MEAELVEAVKNGNSEKIETGLAENKYQKYLFKSVFEGDFLLHIAAKEKNTKIVEALLKAGANPNQGSEVEGSHRGYTAAHDAASNGDIDVLKLLKDYNADFNRCSDDQWYPLHCSVYKGHQGATKFLLDNGANINCETGCHQTPLCFACSHGRVRDVRLLLKHEASLELTDSNFDSLFHYTLHFQMSKLFEGNYDVPDAQLDVAVVLALSGLNPTRVNAEKETAFEFIKESMPSLEKALVILFNNSVFFSAVPIEWNYLGFVSAKAEYLVGLGLPESEAKMLCEAMRATEEERLAAKARRLAEPSTGGCPVMRGKRSTKAFSDPSHAATLPVDGTDPSGGKCPFFQKKSETVSDSTPALPPGHPPLSAESLAGIEGDPSGGKCPFFQKKNIESTSTGNPLTDKKEATSQKGCSSGCPFSPANLQKHTTIILLVCLSFVLGMWVDQRLTNRQ